MPRFNHRLLKSLRLSFGWSIDVTATNLGISKTLYGEYERGNVNYRRGGFDDKGLSVHQLLKGFVTLFQLKGPDALLLPDPVCRFSAPATPELYGRQSQLEILHAARQDKSLNLFVVVGFGGQGKTELVRHWLREVAAPQHWRGLPIFEWSFPRQGEHDERPLSADYFFNALAHALGLADLVDLGAWEKAERLAAFLREEPVLLVLDGLEPLQRCDREPLGTVHDAALHQFLEALSLANAGLCVVTSRLPLMGLRGAEGHGFKSMALPPLGPVAGQQLLRSLGVEGTDKELQDASEELHGNAFGLQLLAKLLEPLTGSRTITHRLLLRHPSATGAVVQDTLLQLIQDYEHWVLSRNSIELNVLEVISIFDEPASPDALMALLKEDAIQGLTTGWNHSTLLRHRSIDALRKVGLILPANPYRSQDLEIHPLVRGYFRQRLRHRSPESLRDAHSRLFDFYSDGLAEQIETWEQLKVCLIAMTHGIIAERYLEALGLAQMRLIQDGSIVDILRFGSLHACIECLSYCFEEPWTQINPAIPAYIHAEILSWSGLAVFTSGQLENGCILFEQALRLMELEQAPLDPSRACALLVVLGECRYCQGQLHMVEKLVRRCDELMSGVESDCFGHCLFQMTKAFLKTLVAQGKGQQESAVRTIQEFFRAFRLAWDRFSDDMGEFYRRNIHIFLTIGYQSCEALADCRRYHEVEDLASIILAAAESMHCPRVIKEVMLLPVLRTRLEQSLHAGRGGGASDALIRAMEEGLEYLRTTDALLPLLRSLLNLARARLMQGGSERLDVIESLLAEAKLLIQRERLVCFQLEYAGLQRWLANTKASIPQMQPTLKTKHLLEAEQWRVQGDELMERSGYRKYQEFMGHLDRRYGASELASMTC